MEHLEELANTLLARAKQADVTVIVAESCTAGLMSQVRPTRKAPRNTSTAAS